MGLSHRRRPDTVNGFVIPRVPCATLISCIAAHPARRCWPGLHIHSYRSDLRVNTGKLMATRNKQSLGQIQEAVTAAQIETCYPVMKQLREEQPWMVEAHSFVSKVQHMQQCEGFRLVYLSHGGAVRAVAGYRVGESLWQGKEMYVADLVTDASSRSQGYGHQLLEWLRCTAAAQGCAAMWLASGISRVDAHRFYEANGVSKVGYVFLCQFDNGKNRP